MKVKLTRREPTAESFNEAQRWTGDPRIRRALIAAHDAAPEEATRALGDVVQFLSDLQRDCVQDDPDSDVRCEYCGSDDNMIQVVADG